MKYMEQASVGDLEAANYGVEMKQREPALPEDDGASNAPVFPPEIFLLILDQLEHDNAKRTLANFARVSKSCHSLALPFLARRMDFSSQGPFDKYYSSYEMSQLVLRWQKSQFLQHVRDLHIENWYLKIDLLPILESCWPTLERLHLAWADAEHTGKIWACVEGFQKLQHLTLEMHEVAECGFENPLCLPASVKSLVLKIPDADYATVSAFLQLLEPTVAQLDYIDMDFIIDEDFELENVPVICSKLRSVELPTLDLSYLVDLPHLDQLRSIKVCYDVFYEANVDWKREKPLPSVEEVYFECLPTSDFTALLRVFPNLKKLILQSPRLKLRREMFSDVRRAVESSKLERIELRGHSVGRVDVQEERRFWKSLGIAFEC